MIGEDRDHKLLNKEFPFRSGSFITVINKELDLSQNKRNELRMFWDEHRDESSGHYTACVPEKIIIQMLKAVHRVFERKFMMAVPVGGEIRLFCLDACPVDKTRAIARLEGEIAIEKLMMEYYLEDDDSKKDTVKLSRELWLKAPTTVFTPDPDSVEDPHKMYSGKQSEYFQRVVEQLKWEKEILLAELSKIPLKFSRPRDHDQVLARRNSIQSVQLVLRKLNLECLCFLYVETFRLVVTINKRQIENVLPWSRDAPGQFVTILNKKLSLPDSSKTKLEHYRTNHKLRYFIMPVPKFLLTEVYDEIDLVLSRDYLKVVMVDSNLRLVSSGDPVDENLALESLKAEINIEKQEHEESASAYATKMTELQNKGLY